MSSKGAFRSILMEMAQRIEAFHHCAILSVSSGAHDSFYTMSSIERVKSLTAMPSGIHTVETVTSLRWSENTKLHIASTFKGPSLKS